MNPRFPSASNAAISPMAASGVDFQDLYSRGIDRAIEIEKASLATVVRLNSCACDLYQNAMWPAPVLGNLFAPATSALAFYVELQMHWLTMMIPHAGRGSVSLSQLAASGTVASSSEFSPTVEVLERSMDVALGGWEAPSKTAASGPVLTHYGNRARAQSA